ncbi:MAG TPA: protein phosphatase 2C domain-containing protein [Kiritimatiellia bacterium]|nr:protein phosphatase 2C domain-containing protein [Kiritimatiellia bacterium]
MYVKETFSHLATAEITDIGLKRARNEDAIIRVNESGVFCVADGIGGASAGDEASAMAVTTLRDEFLAADKKSTCRNFEQRKNLVRQAMNQACQTIRINCHKNGYRESGTTAVTMVFDMENPGKAAVLHAGDSRAYRYRNGHLGRLTRDHTLAVEAGWPEENAWVFGMRTIITRAVGVRPFVDLDETEVDVCSGDVYLLCSDGLTRMLHDRTISDIIRESGIKDLEKTAQELVRQANLAGGRDNITVLLVRVDDCEAVPTDNSYLTTGKHSYLRMCVNWCQRFFRLKSKKVTCNPIR